MRLMTLLGDRSRRSVRNLKAAIPIAIAFLGAGPISSANALCLNEGQTPSQLTIQAARDAVVCLVNERRAENGLGNLVVNLSLQAAAQHHSKAMDKGNFLGHRSPQRRIRRAGYAKGASSWGIGETLSWGIGGRGSPKSVVSAWMASPSHRDTLLSG